jgi:predicted DCC family thiol-disulfide oxidoreductase YuxK
VRITAFENQSCSFPNKEIGMMIDLYRLTVYFDASCSLCRSEMSWIRANDANEVLTFVDCSAPTFDDAQFRGDGVTQKNMMSYLHVRNAEGNWIIGVDAFALLYRTVGKTTIANLWGGRFIRPLAKRVYPWIARHRQLISYTGMPLLFGLWTKMKARKAFRNSQRCRDGQCSI